MAPTRERDIPHGCKPRILARTDAPIAVPDRALTTQVRDSLRNLGLGALPCVLRAVILEALGQLGFGFKSADLEYGRIGGTGQQLPFYQLVEHRASYGSHQGAYGHGDPYAGQDNGHGHGGHHGYDDDHHDGHRSGPGRGTVVAAGAAGLAVGVVGGMVAAEVVDEVGDFFEGDEEEEQGEE